MLKRTSFALFSAVAALALFGASAQAQAGNTNFLTERNGTITFPFSPPNRANSTPGAIDNTTIGATTPAAGTFTALSSSSQSCTVDPCTEQGLNAAQGGAVISQGGTSSTAANAGGAARLIGGTPGATGVGGAANVTGGAGGATSGAGGVAAVTGGAGTAGNGNGGDVNLTGGAANGTGAAGVVRIGSQRLDNQGAPDAEIGTATLTAAALTSSIINGTPVAAAAYTLPLATAMDTALPTSAANDAFDFSVINTSGGANTITVTTNTGWTLVGTMTVAQSVSARFRARKTGAGAWVLYRIS